MYYESYHWAAIDEYFDDFLCFSTKPTKEKLDANYVFNEDGVIFYHGNEKVWLADSIPACYIRIE